MDETGEAGRCASVFLTTSVFLRMHRQVFCLKPRGAGIARPETAAGHQTNACCDRRRQPMDTNRHWVGTWATAPAPSEAGVGFNNHTVRMHPRVSIGGDTVRVRVS